MILKLDATALLFATICQTSSAWTPMQTSKVIPQVTLSSGKSNRLSHDSVFISNASTTAMFAELSDENAPKRKRKRKKKVQVVDADDVNTVEMNENKPEPIETEPTQPVLDLKPREDTPVQLEVKNILAKSREPEPSAIATVSAMLSSVLGSKENSRSDETMTRVSTPTNENSIDDMGFGGKPLDDSLDQLLEDARLMTEEEKQAKGGGVFADEEGAGVKEMIGNTLSTIVTVDFFVVCGFLVWFLLGIFCSYILKDDTVQIAFNNNFEKLVQPALGVLMIAAIGGNFFKEEEQEYDL